MILLWWCGLPCLSIISRKRWVTWWLRYLGGPGHGWQWRPCSGVPQGWIVPLGSSVENFLFGQKRSSNQRSGMILEVQFQNFGTRMCRAPWCTRIKVFIFKNFQGAQILIFFYEYWHGASFYIKEQTKKYKFENWLVKSTILDPLKKCVFGFCRKPPKKCFLRVSALIQRKNNRRTNVSCLVFLKTHKKSYWVSKTPFWPFLAEITVCSLM